MIAYIINRHVDSKFFEPLRGKVIAVTVLSQTSVSSRANLSVSSPANVSETGDLRTWYLSIEDKLYIVDAPPSPPDVTLSSTMAGYLQYLLRQDRSLIHIAGNLLVAETLQNLFSKLDIEWEEVLSQYTGDVVAHQGVRLVKGFAGLNLDQMVAEYLQHESKILPGKHEMREFLDAVDLLRQDVDRLEARLQVKLKHHAANN